MGSGTESKPTLEARFLACLRSMPGAEEIDTLRIPDGVARADFLLAGRAAVAEVKSLETDVAPKVEEIIAPLRLRADFPIFYGRWPIEKVLAKLSDGEAIKAKIYARMSRSIEGAFTKADDQIAGTQGALKIPGAVGILCVLNERVDILSPEVIVHKIAALLKKPGPDGAPRYGRVEQVVILSETHRVPTDVGHILLPIMRLERPGAGGRAVVDSIFEQWSRASGVPVLKATGELTPDMIAKFVSARPTPAKPSRLQRHEFWRQQYRERPYLAKLSLEQFQDLAVRTFAEAARSMLKRAAPLTRAESLAVWERVTHVFEEVNRRGLDMREALPPQLLRKAMELGQS